MNCETVWSCRCRRHSYSDAFVRAYWDEPVDPAWEPVNCCCSGPFRKVDTWAVPREER